MRRLMRIIVVSAMLLTSFTLATRAASAGTPAGFFAVSSTCGGGTGYPVKAGAALAVSTTTPYSGQTIDVSGTNFRAGEKVTLKLNGRVVATVTADSKGSFSTSFKVTAAPGNVKLTASGAVCGIAGLVLAVRGGSGVGGVTATQPAGAGAAGGATGQGGGLAFTGIDVALLLVVALALIGGGGYLAHTGRRRRVHRT